MKKLAVLFLMLICVISFASCGSDREPIGTLVPENLSYTGWYDINNSARSDANFSAIEEQYDGKYVTLTNCKISAIVTKHIVVEGINDPQTVFIYLTKEERTKLIDLNVGDIVAVTGRVKAKKGILGKSFELVDAIFVN